MVLFSQDYSYVLYQRRTPSVDQFIYISGLSRHISVVYHILTGKNIEQIICSTCNLSKFCVLNRCECWKSQQEALLDCMNHQTRSEFGKNNLKINVFCTTMQNLNYDEKLLINSAKNTVDQPPHSPDLAPSEFSHSGNKICRSVKLISN